MSVDINKLVNYQKALIEKRRKMSEYNKNSVVVNYMNVTNQRENIKNEMNKKINKITELTSLLKNKDEEYEDFSKELDFALQMEVQGQPVENLKYNLDKLQKEANTIDTYSKEISDLVVQFQDVYNKLIYLFQNDYKTITQKRNDLIPGAKKVNEDYTVQLNEIQNRINQIKDTLTEEEFSLFKKVSDIVGNLPCISKLNERSCSICGQEVGPAAYQKVAADGYAVCPHCGRIIY